MTGIDVMPAGQVGAAVEEGPGWLEAVRRAAAESFRENGYPTGRHEEWRFTPVQPITTGQWDPARSGAEGVAQEDLGRFVFGEGEWTTLVFVNGEFAPALSHRGETASGVVVGTLAEAIRAGHPAVERHLGRHLNVDESAFAALNTVQMKDGGFIHVPANVELGSPVNLVYVTTAEAAGTVTHPRTLVAVERGARASLIESYVTLAEGTRYWTNPVTEVWTGQGAWLEHTRMQRESEAAYHVGFTMAAQERDSHYRHFSMAMGAAMARHNLHVRLSGENIESLMYGLYLTRGEQVVDNHTAIFHDEPHCNSWEVYKGILDDRSRAVFNGKVFVRPEAQKTDAKQTNRNLVLSDHAKVDTKPQLEIFADDVRCTHGATVGRLDEVALFYARSRGVPEAEAQRLLTFAFAAEVVDEVALEPVRSELNRLVLARLNGEA